MSKLTPVDVREKITKAGVPKLPAYDAINEVSKFGFFFPNKNQFQQ